MNDCMPALRCVCVFVLFVVTGNYFFSFFLFECVLSSVTGIRPKK